MELYDGTTEQGITEIQSLLNKYNIVMPMLRGKTLEELQQRFFSDKFTASYVLALICLLMNGKTIVIAGELAKLSIKYKRERKLWLINLVLDTLYQIEFIKYTKITEDCIIAEIINTEFLDAMIHARNELRKNNDEFKKELDVIMKHYKNSSDIQEFQDKVMGEYNEQPTINTTSTDSTTSS